MKEKLETVRVPFRTEGPLVTSEAVKRRLMEMSREQGRAKSTANIYKVLCMKYVKCVTLTSRITFEIMNWMKAGQQKLVHDPLFHPRCSHCICSAG